MSRLVSCSSSSRCCHTSTEAPFKSASIPEIVEGVTRPGGVEHSRSRLLVGIYRLVLYARKVPALVARASTRGQSAPNVRDQAQRSGAWNECFQVPQGGGHSCPR